MDRSKRIQVAIASGIALLLGALLAVSLVPQAEVTELTEVPEVPAMTAGHRKMLQALQTIRDRSPEESILVGDAEARRLREALRSLPVTTQPEERTAVHFLLGLAELKLGREREAIDRLSEAANRLRAAQGNVRPEAFNETVFQLGVAYMRLGETQNCCRRNTPESCIVPIRGEGIHTNTEGSKKAISCFTEVLGNKSEGAPLRLEALWLLNIAYMTLGGYPKDVPEAYLIPPGVFESDEPFPRFPNIAKSLGIDTFSLWGGAVADDFDNDGYIDLFVSTFDPEGQTRFFRNNQDGTFSDRTTEAGITGLCGGLNMVQADHDNDGDVDILILRGGWLFDKGRHPNSLLENRGDGTFTDVTFEAGLGDVWYPTQTGSWADYDNDGDLDVYIGNEETQLLPHAPCQLFRNGGDGTYRDVAQESGVTNDRFTKGVIWGDYDGDRLPDLYVSNLGAPNRLYHNNGDGSFTDVAPTLGVTGPSAGFPTWFWDFDNDGSLDIFAASYFGDIAVTAAAALGIPFEFEAIALYRGDGRGKFEDVAGSRKLTKPLMPMGANFGDLDNDGYLDFYLGTGSPDYKNLMPSVMYWNRRGEHFADVSTNGGFGHLQKGHAIVFADLDNDGDLDIFEQMGGAFAGDKYNDVLFENPGFGNRWISVQLVGVQTNRSAIGARIQVVVIENGRPRSVYKHVNSGGSFGANPLRQTIGLGKATKIERLEVFWPTSGRTQTFRQVELDKALRIVEGENRCQVLQLKKLTLARSTAAGQ